MTEPAMTLIPVISGIALVFLPILLSRRWFLFYSFVCTLALGTIWTIYIYEASPQERNEGGSPGESFGPIVFLFLPSLLFLAGILSRYIVATHLFSDSPMNNNIGLNDDAKVFENNNATTPHL